MLKKTMYRGTVCEKEYLHTRMCIYTHWGFYHSWHSTGFTVTSRTQWNACSPNQPPIYPL